MGSDSDYVTVTEAASILGVTTGQVHLWSRTGMLDPHYPDGRRPNKLSGKRFLSEDVFNLREIREQLKGGRSLKIPQVAMRALVVARRTERKLGELLRYLGIDTRTLPTEPEKVLAFFATFEDLVSAPPMLTADEIMGFARDLQAVTEEYLELTAAVTKRTDAWEIFTTAGKILAVKCSPGSVQRMYVDHARANLRNIAYFYVRGVKGVRTADRMFPKEGYMTDLLHTLHPAKH